jgi:hypothetical protein
MGNGLAIVAVLGVGCGTSGTAPPPTTTVVTGGASGTPFTIASAASATMTDQNGGGIATIKLTSASDACGDASAHVQRAQAQYLDITVENQTGTTTTAPTSAGDYRVLAFPGASAQVQVVFNDATCTDTLQYQVHAMRGTVTLAAIDTDYYAGTFDVTLTTGDHVTGSFAPEPCPALANATGLTCM